MSYLPDNLDDVEEAKPAPQGSYELQITGAEETVTGENSKHPGSPMFKVTIGFTNEPNVPNIIHYISLPYDGDENAAFKLLMLKRFLALFNIPYTNDTEALVMGMLGQTTTADVTLAEPDDSGNVYNRLKIPRLRNEPTSGKGKAPSRRGHGG